MKPTESDPAIDSTRIDSARIDSARWTTLADAQRNRVDDLLARHPARQSDSQELHPVWGFLFSYYSFRPAALRRWHPGVGVELIGGYRYRSYAGYRATDRGAIVDENFLGKRLATVRFVHQLLTHTSQRPAQLNCFGLHEWAMVYQQPTQRRHSVALRLSAADTDTVVESQPLRCTHFDAFRFFTDTAVPRNQNPLSRERQLDDEQPGCIHAGMDLYKWAYKLSPLVDSTLVVDAFELALSMRELDMRASPYDLSDYQCSPIPVETAAGRAQYAREQKALTDQAAMLRQRIIDAAARVLEYPRDTSPYWSVT